MDLLLKDLIPIIANKLNFYDKQRFKHTCRRYYKIIKIHKLPGEFLLIRRLDDNILKYYPHLTELHTDNNKVTDAGIRNLPLTLLDASGNSLITDEGIMGMQLHTLYACYNLNITDAGIVGMPLRELFASYQCGITDAGIIGLPLQKLIRFKNHNITEATVKKLKERNPYLYVSF